MNIPSIIKDWIDENSEGTAIEGLTVFLPSTTAEITIPCLTVVESGAEEIEQDGVPMRGVYRYEIDIRHLFIPGSADPDKTRTEAESARDSMVDILANTEYFTLFADKRHQTTVFDIRCGPPIIEGEDGTLSVRFPIQVIACPKV